MPNPITGHPSGLGLSSALNHLSQDTTGDLGRGLGTDIKTDGSAHPPQPVGIKPLLHKFCEDRIDAALRPYHPDVFKF